MKDEVMSHFAGWFDAKGRAATTLHPSAFILPPFISDMPS
jgi:hypothetical protein